MSKAKLVLAEVTVKPETSQRRIVVRRNEPLYQVIEAHNMPSVSPIVNTRITWGELHETYPEICRIATLEVSRTIFVDWASYKYLDKDGNPINVQK